VRERTAKRAIVKIYIARHTRRWDISQRRSAVVALARNGHSAPCLVRRHSSE
jgi:hypothetical protein